MELEKRVIKGNEKKYKRKSDNKEIIKQSLYINLGVNSCFNADDEVIILTEENYNSIVNDNASDDTIKQLNDEIAKLNSLMDSREQEITQLSNANLELNSQIATLNDALSDKDTVINGKDTAIKELEKEIAKYNSINIDELQQKAKEVEQYKNIVISLQNEKIEFKDVINYLNNCIDRLEHRNIILRVMNKDNTSDVAKPSLKLIDYNGNSLTKSDVNSDNILIDRTPKSE